MPLKRGGGPRESISSPKRANSLGGEAYRSNEPVNTNLPIELALFVRQVSPGSDTNCKESGALA